MTRGLIVCTCPRRAGRTVIGLARTRWLPLVVSTHSAANTPDNSTAAAPTPRSANGENLKPDHPLLAGGQGLFYPLKVGLNTWAAPPTTTWSLDDAYVSRRHCAILVHHDSRFELHDTASKNGTFVNGARSITPIRLTARRPDPHLRPPVVFLSPRRRPAGSAAHPPWPTSCRPTRSLAPSHR